MEFNIIYFTGIPTGIHEGIADALLLQFRGGLGKCRLGPVVVDGCAQNLSRVR